jgi:hypothetical protein
MEQIVSWIKQRQYEEHAHLAQGQINVKSINAETESFPEISGRSTNSISFQNTAA